MLPVRRTAVTVAAAGLTLALAAPAWAAAVTPIPKFTAGGWAREASLAADAAGRATAVWDTGRGDIRASMFTGSSWSCPVVLPDSGNPLVYAGGSWSLDVAANGNAAFAGTLTNRGIAIWTRQGPNGQWKKVVWTNPNAASITEEHGPAKIAVTGGVAFAAWHAGYADDGTNGVYGVQVPIGSTAPVSPTPLLVGDGVMGQEPDVAVDANGNSLAMILNGDADGNWLEQVIWPRGGTPSVTRRIQNVEGDDSATSAHANASGQLIASWTHLPGENIVHIMAATGTVTGGIASETAWHTNDQNYYTDSVGTDIADNGNAAMVAFDQTGAIFSGVGNASGGPTAFAQSATGAAPSGLALGGDMDVTVSDNQAWIAYTNPDDRAFLAQITASGLNTTAQRAGMVLVTSAVVKVQKTTTGAMMGENDGQSMVMSSLPNTVKPPQGKRKC